ncbi:TIM44-like domain-containing protein [Bradyrhizobium sp. ISRA443]|uniref:TIM44-like domain-containing protein n=1 Tax=unclassified Bradyrhizobium TaxID=2631580 RepID=UPI00247B2503|nr:MULTISPECIES: TIM44-like domain-containing protein [unclassified Bradyrhizobium]WGR98253.1 TIM44-like domain-containing protein [Bradyrhizobium sp. ISRA436]WGS05142.1 TIM44-like domain-containing protein [Bradyrhizobium sp. ISRA437]WGS12027.1 TIM44-like domain-containing protein [Bradyrhizobium sp. ISRA443]
MPEDGNGSGIVALLWGLWVYGLFKFWFEHLSSLAKAKAAQHSRQAISHLRPSTPSAPARCTDLEALASNILICWGGLTLTDFLNGRLTAYEAIVAAFEAGDQVTLLRHVSPEVYAAFTDAFAAREDLLEKTDAVFALVMPPEIVAARIDGTHAEISIRFIADSYKLSESGQRRREGQHRVDVWTFGCTLPGSRWSLIATEAGK